MGEKMGTYPKLINSAEEIDGKTVDKIINSIINLFAEQHISYSSACYILDIAKENIGDCCIVHSLDRSRS